MKDNLMRWLITFIAISICVVAKGNVSEAATTYTVTYNVYEDCFTEAFEGTEEATKCYEKAYSTKEYIVTKGIPLVSGTVKSNFVGWSYSYTSSYGATMDDVDVRPGENLGILDSDITLYPVTLNSSNFAKIYFRIYRPSGDLQTDEMNTAWVLENCYFDYLGNYEPHATGYDFIGWSTTKGATTPEFGAEGPYLNDFAENDSTVNLYAVWEPKTHDIVFDANGGTFEGDVTSVTRQTKSFTSLDISDLVPVRENYVFIGWYENAAATSVSYTTAYKEDVLTYTTQNLYAVWAPKEYVITYDSNGGTGVPENQAQTYEQAITIPATVPVKEGYKFLGWTCTGGGKYYNPGDSFVRTSDMGSADTIKMTAAWEIKKYTVTYDLNGGVEGSGPQAQTKTHGVVLELFDTQPFHNYGSFMGWATKKDATTANMGSTYALNADITLYAVWDLEQYTITFDDNGGYYGPISAYKTYGKALTIPTTTPEKEGYTFLGWATSISATTAEYKVGSSYTAEGDATLYAVWQKGTLAGEDAGNTITNPSAPTSQIITASNQSIVYKKNKKVALKVSTNGGGALIYKTSNKKVVTVNKTTGKLTIKGYGKATITITAAKNGNYLKTTKKITVTITPKKVTLKSAKSPSKKMLSATWKKEAAASGYFVQFSPSKKFKVDTFERKFGKSETSMKLFGLKSKKTFYVRVCAYKSVKGKKICGPWSNVRPVKVK